jgi:predicted nucleic acid-binding protein
MYTLDASVHVSALNPVEESSVASQDFLALVREHRLPVVSPMLLLVEVAAALARVLDDDARTVAMAVAVSHLPNQRLVTLDRALAELAIDLAARARLRGAGAVYAAVARHHGTTLVTLDGQQLGRLTGVVPVVRPGDALVELEALRR